MGWDDANALSEDTPVAPYNISRGPRLGVQEGFVATLHEQTLNNSILGLAWYWSKKDDEQAQKAKAAGKQYTPLHMQQAGTTIDEMGNESPSYIGYKDVYKDMAKQFMDGVESPYSKQIAAHEAHIRKLNEEDPNLKLKSMSEMYADLKQEAKRAEYRASLPTTWGGLAGGLAGSAVGAVDPRTDPLNTLGFFLSGGGSAAARIGVQGLGQMGVETFNQLTGVAENRRLLGLDQQNPLLPIIGAGIGGAVFQGLGEGIGATARRITTGKWWADAPNDPAPLPPAAAGAGAMPAGPAAPIPPIRGMPGEPTPRPPTPELPPQLGGLLSRIPEPQSPLPRTRFGAPRAEFDLEHARAALQPWEGPPPWDIPVPTETRLPAGQPPDIPRFRIETPQGTDSMDALARRYDPDLFNTYDRLLKQRSEALGTLGKEEFDATLILSNRIARLNEQIRELSNRAPRTQRLVNDIAALEREVAVYREEIRTRGAPETADVRSTLAEVNEQMTDLKKPLERAYDHGQKKWEGQMSSRVVEIDHMVSNGLSGIDNSPVRTPPPPVEPIPPLGSTLPPEWSAATQKFGANAVPELQTANGAPRPGETYADAILRVNKEQEQFAKEAQDNFVNTIMRVARGEPVMPPGAAPAAPAAGAAPAPMNVASYVNDYIAGLGRDSKEHLQFAANNAAAIEAEFARRADTTKQTFNAFISGQKGRSAEQLHLDAQGLQDEIAKAGPKVGKDTGAVFKNPGVKEFEKIAEKIERKGYKEPGQITDLARAGFTITTRDQANRVVNELAKHFDILDEGWKINDVGYQDRKVLVRGADGTTVGEIQIFTAEMYRLKKSGGQDLYDRYRSLPDGPEKDALAEQQRQHYAPARDALDGASASETATDTASSVSSGAKSENIPRQTVSDSRPPVPETSAVSTGTQGAPGSRTATATVPPSEGTNTSTAGRLSQSTNLSEGSGITPNVIIGITPVKPGGFVRVTADTATSAAAAGAPSDILTMRVNGKNVSIHLDNDIIEIELRPGEVRKMSVREMAKEMEDDNKMLQAVTSCSLTPTS